MFQLALRIPVPFAHARGREAWLAPLRWLRESSESGGKPPFLTSSFLRLEPSPRSIKRESHWESNKRESHRESNGGDIKACRKLGKLGVGKGGFTPAALAQKITGSGGKPPFPTPSFLRQRTHSIPPLTRLGWN